MLIGIISDTHMPRGPRRLPDACVERLLEVDLILHAGDVATLEVLAEIEAIGPPVVAVRGNVDEPVLRLAEQVVLDLGGATVAMLHDAGPAKGRLERMRLRFPVAVAVVFGHSHIPLHEERDGFAIFNPGSPTERRRSPRHTMGLATVRDGRVTFELVALD